MKTLGSLIVCGVVFLAVSPNRATAQTTYEAFLTGLGENPQNGSPGTGFGTVILNAAHTMITVNENWSGLTAPATASHIHSPAPAGMNGPVLFPFSGVPAATAGSIPTQSFAITAAQVSDLQNGLMYMNVHTSTFPGGEIRGQLALFQTPEPSSFALLGLGVAGLFAFRRTRRHR